MPTIYMRKNHDVYLKIHSPNDDWLWRGVRRMEELGFHRCTWFRYVFRRWFSQ